MKELVCIVCPKGCRLAVSMEKGELQVKGNGCPRGAAFASSEVTHPMRSLTTTVKTDFSDLPYLPVRTKGEIGKEEVRRVMKSLASFCLHEEVHCGDIILRNVAGTGCDIIATLDCLHSSQGK